MAMLRSFFYLYSPEVVEFAEDLLVFDVAAHVPPQRRLADAAREAAAVPAQVVHLQSTTTYTESHSFLNKDAN